VVSSLDRVNPARPSPHSRLVVVVIARCISVIIIVCCRSIVPALTIVWLSVVEGEGVEGALEIVSSSVSFV
jgi:hypothetical protein